MLRATLTLHHVLNLDEDSQPTMSVFVFIVSTVEKRIQVEEMVVSETLSYPHSHKLEGETEEENFRIPHAPPPYLITCTPAL